MEKKSKYFYINPQVHQRKTSHADMRIKLFKLSEHMTLMNVMWVPVTKDVKISSSLNRLIANERAPNRTWTDEEMMEMMDKINRGFTYQDVTDGTHIPISTLWTR